eukprot:scaffold78412_cov15-Prasinocladus_malaysianus.AAC.1
MSAGLFMPAPYTLAARGRHLTRVYKSLLKVAQRRLLQPMTSVHLAQGAKRRKASYARRN